MRAGHAADLRVAALRRHGPAREDRMRVGDDTDDVLGRDRGRAVQRHAEGPVGIEGLQVVHVIGDRAAPPRGSARR